MLADEMPHAPWQPPRALRTHMSNSYNLIGLEHWLVQD